MAKNDSLQVELKKAREQVTLKQAALHEAQLVVASASKALDEAFEAVTEAQKAIDDRMPQCRMVSIQWRTGKLCGPGLFMVILRKTPGGMLIVRERGNEEAQQYKFKWWPHSRVYREFGKANSSMSNARELRDVPKEFLPD